VTEPWDDPRITAFGMLLEAHAAVVTQVNRDLEATSGIPITWMEVLLRLARSPGHRLRMAELARQVGLSTSGLTRLIDRVEHAGYVNNPRWFTKRMYAASARLTAWCCKRHKIPVDRRYIIGHSQVPGATHTDPGRYWNWDRYMKLVRYYRRRL